ncbi:MAG: dTMP kinase [Fibrobacter sp.]|jgi:dTMP kinase|nr:dTMP kinase [Fibrobacter sp.]
MRKGVFITFEGIDGCGKSTQLELAAKKLGEQSFPLLVTREPGGTAIAEKIREILISPQNSEMVNECELLMYLAARAQHVREKIIPAIEQGFVVLCDRFQEATFAYQGFGRNIPLDFLEKINSFATGGLSPDLTFVFDISVDLSNERMQKMNKAKDRLELNGRTFYQKIAEGYRFLAKKEPQRILLLDGSEPLERISEQVYCKIKDILKNHLSPA